MYNALEMFSDDTYQTIAESGISCNRLDKDTKTEKLPAKTACTGSTFRYCVTEVY